MKTVRVEQLYHQYIESIPISEQLELISVISQHVAQYTMTQEHPKTRSLLELEGLGAEIWKGIDAQEYVNDLRDEWEGPPV
ncbi:hypothetical protein GF339_02995 [candidate division KSB3 bacterium]|uniref:Uncharacterized protein n=1 Tax=candidate division KSB3 bacterium TaxID=2044937 RepID=A0A9D5JSN1_9BACT|nr:hypothetical protein [candidate division KSB3 bacterium]MBD3323522.1 hypothetical protein [candidate division KSB3 bacterium]